MVDLGLLSPENELFQATTQGAMENWTKEIVGTLIATIVGILGWFVRTVLTDSKKIEILERDFEARMVLLQQIADNQQKFQEDTKIDIRELRASLQRLLEK